MAMQSMTRGRIADLSRLAAVLSNQWRMEILIRDRGEMSQRSSASASHPCRNILQGCRMHGCCRREGRHSTSFQFSNLASDTRSSSRSSANRTSRMSNAQSSLRAILNSRSLTDFAMFVDALAIGGERLQIGLHHLPGTAPASRPERLRSELPCVAGGRCADLLLRPISRPVWGFGIDQQGSSELNRLGRRCQRSHDARWPGADRTP